MAHGKTIELFLAEGTSDGLVTAELSNWNGKAIKISRTLIKNCKRPDIQKAGVYFLFCEDDNGRNSVYIGESLNVLDRLKQHCKDYDNDRELYYWSTAVVFSSDALNKAHIQYLEDKLVRLARNAGRYQILTQNTTNTTLSEAATSTMEEFADNIKILISALGYKVLTPTSQPVKGTVSLFCNGTSVKASGFLSTGGFTVQKGSTISDKLTKACTTGQRILRERLIEDGVVQDNTFTRDYEFKSPSAASTIVLGHPSSGPADWKTEAGIPLRDLGE